MHVKKIDDIESEVVEAGSGVSRQMLIGPEEGPNFAMRKLVIEPGGGIPAHTSGAEQPTSARSSCEARTMSRFCAPTPCAAPG